MNAYEELLVYLKPYEKVNYIVFGEWGWGGYEESDPPSVPLDKRGVLLTLEEAKPYMQDWQFDGGFGAPFCHAVHVWTDERVIFVSEYDGSTHLNSVPRNPSAEQPRMT